jgi:hypothetical protein
MISTITILGVKPVGFVHKEAPAAVNTWTFEFVPAEADTRTPTELYRCHLDPSYKQNSPASKVALKTWTEVVPSSCSTVTVLAKEAWVLNMDRVLTCRCVEAAGLATTVVVVALDIAVFALSGRKVEAP